MKIYIHLCSCILFCALLGFFSSTANAKLPSPNIYLKPSYSDLLKTTDIQCIETNGYSESGLAAGLDLLGFGFDVEFFKMPEITCNYIIDHAKQNAKLKFDHSSETVTFNLTKYFDISEGIFIYSGVGIGRKHHKIASFVTVSSQKASNSSANFHSTNESSSSSSESSFERVSSLDSLDSSIANNSLEDSQISQSQSLSFVGNRAMTALHLKLGLGFPLSSKVSSYIGYRFATCYEKDVINFFDTNDHFLEVGLKIKFYAS